MRKTLFVPAFALAVVISSLAACYVPKPVAHARLHVAEDGTLLLNGAPISLQDLQTQVAKIRPAETDLVVKIEVGSSANMDLVRAAVDAVKRAQARVAFAKEGGLQ